MCKMLREQHPRPNEIVPLGHSIDCREIEHLSSESSSDVPLSVAMPILRVFHVPVIRLESSAGGLFSHAARREPTRRGSPVSRYCSHIACKQRGGLKLIGPSDCQTKRIRLILLARPSVDDNLTVSTHLSRSLSEAPSSTHDLQGHGVASMSLLLPSLDDDPPCGPTIAAPCLRFPTLAIRMQLTEFAKLESKRAYVEIGMLQSPLRGEPFTGKSMRTTC